MLLRKQRHCASNHEFTYKIEKEVWERTSGALVDMDIYQLLAYVVAKAIRQDLRSNPRSLYYPYISDEISVCLYRPLDDKMLYVPNCYDRLKTPGEFGQMCSDVTRYQAMNQRFEEQLRAMSDYRAYATIGQTYNNHVQLGLNIANQDEGIYLTLESILVDKITVDEGKGSEVVVESSFRKVKLQRSIVEVYVKTSPKSDLIELNMHIQNLEENVAKNLYKDITILLELFLGHDDADEPQDSGVEIHQEFGCSEREVTSLFDDDF